MPETKQLKPYQFKPGQSGNPKGPDIGGRRKCLQLIDRLLAQKGNLVKLQEHFQKIFDKNPGGFYLKFVVPILPKEAKLDIDVQGTIQTVHSIIDIGRLDNGRSPAGDSVEGPPPGTAEDSEASETVHGDSGG